VSRESVWCFSLARQSKKRSRGERRQSKLNDVFHWYVFFCEFALRPHKFKPAYRSKPLRKVNVRPFGAEYEGGSLKTPARSHTIAVSSLCLRWFASVSGAASLAFARVLAFATSVAGLAAALTLTIVLAFARVFTLFGISHGLEGDARIAQSARGIARTATDPVRRPATAAPAITAFDRLIIYQLSFLWLLFPLLHDGVRRGEPSIGSFFTFRPCT